MSDIITTEDFAVHYDNRLLQHIDDIRYISEGVSHLISDIELSWHSASANSTVLKLQQMLEQCNAVSANLEETQALLVNILKEF